MPTETLSNSKGVGIKDARAIALNLLLRRRGENGISFIDPAQRLDDLQLDQEFNSDINITLPGMETLMTHTAGGEGGNNDDLDKPDDIEDACKPGSNDDRE